jgi:hypothetical protein
MINRNKKYKETSTIPYPSVGQLLGQFAQQNHVNKSALGRTIGVSPKVVSDYFKRSSLQMGIVWNLSIALNHNFVAQIAEQMPIDFETKKEVALKEKNLSLQQQIEKLEIELAVYKSITNSKL